MSNNETNSTPSRTIVIAERDNIATLVENGKVVEFFIHRGDMLLGDVYLATVENILPSIDAAFVNLGADRMGFLHASDVPGKGDLKDRLEPKQKVLVQIMKEPTGHKGPRVSTSLSIPGRFVVLMPEEKSISISRKVLSPKERSRLKSIVSLIKPPGVGVIIRTEAEHQSEEEIREDLEICLEKWQNIVTTADSVSPPTLIHRDQDLLYRVIREACTDDVKEIFIDTPFGHHRVNQLIQTWNLGKDIKVNVYKGPDSLIVSKGLDKEIKSALQSKVNLPSGGYLYVQPTEALTVIDVNSGRFTSSQTQGETIRQTNLEAVEEIARQLRLRNIGGMIVIDFIDMDNRVDQLAILEAFEMALLPDKAKPQVGQLSDLGLVELTRHRQGQSLAEIFTKKCPACNGTGHVLEDLTFSPSLESEIRSRPSKTKPVPRLKPTPTATPAKAEITQAQKGIKPRIMKPDKPAPFVQGISEQPKTPAGLTPKPPAPKEKPALTETPEVPPAETDTLYSKSDKPESLELLSFEKLRKASSSKTFYPEISKVIRFAGVPLKYAREHFGEEINMIDVFTILDEMEAAFARAASTTVETPPPIPKEPVQYQRKPLHAPKESPEKLKEIYAQESKEEFKGRYGVSANGEDFEELYEVIDDEEDIHSVENDSAEEFDIAEESIDSDELESEASEASEESEEGDEAEEGDEGEEESEDNENAKDSTSTKAQSPARRGRKSAKTTSARKRGRPKTNK